MLIGPSWRIKSAWHAWQGVTNCGRGAHYLRLSLAPPAQHPAGQGG